MGVSVKSLTPSYFCLTYILAGLCVQETAQRNEVISLITACETRTGWPMSTLREDLYKEWKKCDFDERVEDVEMVT